MEYLLLPAVIIGSKYIVIGSARLVYKIIAESNHAINSIDGGGHGDRYFPFGSRKSGNKMSADLVRSVHEKLQ